MNIPQHILVSAALVVCVIGKSDVDFVDTDSTGDKEAPLKCDACAIVTQKFSESFSKLREELTPPGQMPHDEDIINAAENVCDDAWKGYGVTVMNGQEKLTILSGHKKLSEVEEAVWSRRLQDMCDELLGEASDEKSLYNVWASGNSLQDYMCRGDGTFGACASDDWGPWPGDDYDDYEDSSDFEDIHDEF